MVAAGRRRGRGRNLLFHVSLGEKLDRVWTEVGFRSSGVSRFKGTKLRYLKKVAAEEKRRTCDELFRRIARLCNAEMIGFTESCTGPDVSRAQTSDVFDRCFVAETSDCKGAVRTSRPHCCRLENHLVPASHDLHRVGFILSTRLMIFITSDTSDRRLLLDRFHFTTTAWGKKNKSCDILSQIRSSSRKLA